MDAEERDSFRQAYVAARGYWAPFNDGLLEHSPEWLRTYLAYSSTPARVGPLSPRMRELIYVAVDGSTTHLFMAGFEIHARIALSVGCTVDELVEVMQIATMQGVDSVALGMDVLAEEMTAAGCTPPEDPAAEALLDRYAKLFGDRPRWLAMSAHLSPEWGEALVTLLETGEQDSRLSQLERTLIRLALASSPTHLNANAVRVETRRALALGGSPEEIAQVFQLVAHLGIHACSDGIPAIVRVAEEGGR